MLTYFKNSLPYFQCSIHFLLLKRHTQFTTLGEVTVQLLSLLRNHEILSKISYAQHGKG
jgi:hypothetical protein